MVPTCSKAMTSCIFIKSSSTKLSKPIVLTMRVHSQWRKFLEFMLLNKGTEVNPDKCRAMFDIKSPKNIKEFLLACMSYSCS